MKENNLYKNLMYVFRRLFCYLSKRFREKNQTQAKNFVRITVLHVKRQTTFLENSDIKKQSERNKQKVRAINNLLS